MAEFPSSSSAANVAESMRKKPKASSDSPFTAKDASLHRVNKCIEQFKEDEEDARKARDTSLKVLDGIRARARATPGDPEVLEELASAEATHEELQAEFDKVVDARAALVEEKNKIEEDEPAAVPLSKRGKRRR
jgi:hypothetical protein